MKTPRIEQPGHRAAQPIRDTEAATAPVAVSVVDLNPTVALHRDRTAATQHPVLCLALFIELQVDAFNMRGVSGQREQQTSFQCLLILVSQTPASINNLQSHRFQSCVPSHPPFTTLILRKWITNRLIENDR
jgi:hypothetical protein